MLLASTYYPAGRTVFVGFDSTWLWRKYYRDRYTEKFWRSLVRFAALNKLRKTNKRFDLLIDKALYDVNEPVQVSARARTTLSEFFSMQGAEIEITTMHDFDRKK